MSTTTTAPAVVTTRVPVSLLAWLAAQTEGEGATYAAWAQRQLDRPAVRQPRPCGCGCGETTLRAFAPGHDARLVSSLATQVVEGKVKVAQVPDLVSQAGGSDKLAEKAAQVAAAAAARAQAKAQRKAERAQAKAEKAA